MRRLAHYANAATDIEYNFPFGFKEVEGIHSRTDFDLGNHQKYSGKKMQYFDPETGESYVPYVVETSIGVDRMFLQVMSAAYTEEALEGGDSRVVLRFPAALAPVKVAVLPLVKKDGMPEVAQKIVDLLKYDYNVVYDEKGFGGQTLPPSGCHRHAVLRDGRRPDARRRYGNGPSPRHDGPGAREDRGAAGAGRRGVLLPSSSANCTCSRRTTFSEMGRILAIDYGTKRTGIAVSDPLRLIAGGLKP